MKILFMFLADFYFEIIIQDDDDDIDCYYYN